MKCRQVMLQNIDIIYCDRLYGFVLYTMNRCPVYTCADSALRIALVVFVPNLFR